MWLLLPAVLASIFVFVLLHCIGDEGPFSLYRFLCVFDAVDWTQFSLAQSRRIDFLAVCSPRQTGPHREIVSLDPINSVLVDSDTARLGHKQPVPQAIDG